MRWRTAYKAASKAHGVLRGPAPAGITGKQQLDRTTRARRLRRVSVEALGRSAEPPAASALVELLLIATRDHDEELTRLVVAALGGSPAPGVAREVGERALLEGVEVLARHREPALLPRLEAAIATGEATMPRWWCLAICVAALYGHAPSRERLPELFGNPVGLDDARWLAPMLRVLVSGTPDEGWELTAPVREILLSEPRPRGRVTGPLISVLVDVVGKRGDLDRRWTELACEVSTHANPSVAWRAHGALLRLARDDESLRQRLLELGAWVHLDVLAQLGDERVGAPLRALLDSDRLPDLAFVLEALARLGPLPRDLVETAVVRAARANLEIADDHLHTLLDRLGPFESPALASELLQAVDDAIIVTDGDSVTAREGLMRRLEALASASPPGA